MFCTIQVTTNFGYELADFHMSIFGTPFRSHADKTSNFVDLHIRTFLSLVTHILPHGWCSQYCVMPRTSFLLFALFTTHCCAAKQIAQDAAQDAVFPFGDRKLHTTARTSNSSWGRGPSPSRQDANCTKAGVWPAMRCIAHGGGRRCDEPGCDKIALGYKGTASKCFGHGEVTCIEPGCAKAARGPSGRCISHGGGKRCTEPGCDKGAEGSTGKCYAHGGRR